MSDKEFNSWWKEYLSQGGTAHFNINADRESAEAAWEEKSNRTNVLLERTLDFLTNLHSKGGLVPSMMNELAELTVDVHIAVVTKSKQRS